MYHTCICTLSLTPLGDCCDARPTPARAPGRDDDDLYPRETPPNIRTARASPRRHTAAGTAAPTTADTGNTVP